MKKVLITGKNSYIGANFIQFVNEHHLDIETTELDMIDGTWRNEDFSKYDSVFHVAGLAHSTPDESMRDMYYKINTALAIETAKKAKKEGVKQFVFMSSIIVYGNGIVGESRVINRETPLNPYNFYGDSKVQAEKGLLPLQDENFHVVIVRPPMIYGHNSKGNYPRLAKFAIRFPMFPAFKNERSMLYIKNLCSFISLVIKNNDKGIFLPQNDEYVCTAEMVKKIANLHRQPMWLVRFANPFICMFKKRAVVNKVFGNLVIDRECSAYKESYCLVDFETSLKETELG